MLSKLNLSNQIHQTSRSGGFLFLFLLSSFSCLAQATKTDSELPKDDRGKYIYYEIVDKSPVPADSLKQRALAFFKLKKLTSIVQKKDGLQADGKMIINKTAFVLTHPAGEVLYHFTFEIKEGKYRYWLTDFLFLPYKRDRYGNFVATTVKGTPLESDPGKLNAGEWNANIEAANKQAAAFSAAFKTYLSAVQKNRNTPEAKKTISTKSW